MRPNSVQPNYIHYAELRADDAQAQLRELAQYLSQQTGFVDAALLHSEAQGLWLLESRWVGGVPALPSKVTLPVGAKAWAFAVREFVSGP